MNERWQTFLRQPPYGLVFDIDGTLSPIASTPKEAKLLPGVVELLQQAQQYAQVAIMTGRAIEDGARMVHVEGLTYIGNHGLEWSDGLPEENNVRIPPEALVYIEPGQRILNEAKRLFAGRAGISVEQKRIGGSIHYRLAENPEQVRAEILEKLAEPARAAHMRLTEGKRVVEVKTPLKIDKGQALRTFVELKGVRAILFAGDDRTDLDALLEIERLREQGIAGVGVAVQHHDTFPELLEHADIVVQEVEGMGKLLAEIVEDLRQKGSGEDQAIARPGKI